MLIQYFFYHIVFISPEMLLFSLSPSYCNLWIWTWCVMSIGGFSYRYLLMRIQWLLISQRSWTQISTQWSYLPQSESSVSHHAVPIPPLTEQTEATIKAEFLSSSHLLFSSRVLCETVKEFVAKVGKCYERSSDSTVEADALALRVSLWCFTSWPLTVITQQKYSENAV